MGSQFAAENHAEPSPVEGGTLTLLWLTKAARRAETVDEFIAEIRARREAIVNAKDTEKTNPL